MVIGCVKITYILPNGTCNKCSRDVNYFSSFEIFKTYLISRLPEEMKDNGELRFYWIDNNGDEIDILNSCDYFAFKKLKWFDNNADEIDIGDSCEYFDLKKLGCFHHVFVGTKNFTEFPAQPTPGTSHSDHRYPSYVKITYKLNGTKFTRYFDHCYKGIAKYLFNELKQDTHKLRYYWIDDNGDEVDIENEADYFVPRRPLNIPHIYIAPMNQSTLEEDNPATMANNTSDSSKTVNPTAVEGHLPKTNVSHDANNVSLNVKCDSCVMEPIVGFRYKCTQCVNYDHLMILKPNVDGEKCKESDRNEECSHVHQSFFTQLFEMMNNFVKEFGTEETAAGITKIPLGNFDQDSKCKLALGSTNVEGQNVDAISVKTGAIETNVIHETSTAKDPESTTTIDCEQPGMVAANNRTDSATFNTKIPRKTIDHKLILKTLNEAENVITQRGQGKSSENPNKVIHETLSARSKEASSQSLKHFIQSHDPELVRNGFEIWKNFNNMFAKMFELTGEVEGDVEAKQPFAANLREEANFAQQINDISKSMNYLNTTTPSFKSVENNGEQKKRQEDNENECNNSISEPLLKLNTSSQDNKVTPAVRPTTPTTLNNLNF
ncbi:uncharacterized protein isoform X2 [Musca autumnalis]